jgi:8-oxo-dGTP pyrophosphatase MutT (NUDIX family)
MLLPSIIGHRPYATAGLIFNKKRNLFLAVSRKHDFNDLGIPGGKIDQNENFIEACVREVQEETGLIVTRLLPIFGDYVGKPTIDTIYWNLTFLCKASGKVQTSEQIRIAWVPPSRLIKNENGKLNSFGKYNSELLTNLSFVDNLDEWSSEVDIDPNLVEIT